MKKILVVDDSPVARKILISCMPKDLPLEISEAGDGLSGLHKFESLEPDITFIDLTMPVMGGMEVLEAIRRTRPQSIVVVASADIQPATQERCMSLGAFALLRKPPSAASVAEVFSAIQDYLEKK